MDRLHAALGITTSPPPLTCRLGVRLPAGINRMNTKHSNEYVSNRNKHTQTNYKPTRKETPCEMKRSNTYELNETSEICNRMSTKHKSNTK